jgi:hypothetical protein
MCKGKNPKNLAANDLGDVVGKDTQIDAVISRRSEPWNLRMDLNPGQIGTDFITQPATQPKLDVFVTSNRLAQFLLCFVKKNEFHHAKRLLISAKTASHGFPSACPASMALMR